MDKKVKGGKVEYLVRWKGYPGKDSWEPSSTILEDAPDHVAAYLEVTAHSLFTPPTMLVPAELHLLTCARG